MLPGPKSIVVGDRAPFQFVFTQDDGTPQDLTGASVWAVLVAPNGSATQQVATIASPATAGIANYVSVPTDFPAPGAWQVTGHVSIPDTLDRIIAQTCSVTVVLFPGIART